MLLAASLSFAAAGCTGCGDLPTSSTDPATRARVQDAYAHLPLHFIENRGHLDPQVAYYASGLDTTFYFTSRGVSMALLSAPTTSSPGRSQAALRPRHSTGSREHQRWVLALDFVGASPGLTPVGEEPTGAAITYFKGPRDQWKTGVKSFAKVTYPEVWPGIDAVHDGDASRLKYTFVVRPGADPAQIQLALRGAASVTLDASGALEIATPAGTLRDEAPVAYQLIDGRRAPVAIRYALDAGAGLQTNPEAPVHYGFEIGAYDPGRPLIVDPVVLLYTRTVDGVGPERGLGIAVDAQGSAYVCGATAFGDLPLTVGPDLTHNGYLFFEDAFVGKLKPDGSGFVYLGLIGGELWDQAFAIAVDASGAAYVGGFTGSDETTFPVVGGLGRHFQGGSFFGPMGVDAFVAKVDPSGTDLVYSGYVGGAGDEAVEGIVVDARGSAYVSGFTSSTEATFPVVVGPDLTHNGGYDTFVAKIKPDGSGLEYCGYIGGAGDDTGVFAGGTSLTGGSALAVDAAGNAYVGNFTSSREDTFPNGQGFASLSIPGFRKAHGGGRYDAFVAKVKADGSGLAYATYLGGTGEEGILGVAVDAGGNAHVCGYTSSSDGSFPVLGGPDLHHHGGSPPDPTAYASASDAFVAKLGPDGATLRWSGFIGGAGDEVCQIVRLDEAGRVHLVGSTESDEATFPVVNGPGLSFNGGSDAFVARLRPDPVDPVVTQNFDYLGYIGGPGHDSGFDLGVDAAGNAYVVGDLASDTGQRAAFVVKVGLGTPPPWRDDFDAATSVSTLPFSDRVDLSFATASPDDPDVTDTVPPLWGTTRLVQTVWYHFTPARDLTVSTDLGCNGPIGAVVAAFTGSRGSLNQVLPFLGPAGMAAYRLQAGVTYHFMIGIACDPFSCGGVGEVAFSVRELRPPANDDFDSAVAITSLPFKATGDLSDATAARDDPSFPLGAGSVWYRFTPARDVTIEASALGAVPPGTQLPASVLVYEGSRGTLTSPGLGTRCGDYWPIRRVRVRAKAGTTYYLRVASEPGLGSTDIFSCPLSAPGPFALTVEELAGPANDDLERATVIRRLPFSDRLEVGHATAELDEVLFGCSGCPKKSYERTVWYSLTPRRSMAVEVSTAGSDYDTILVVSAGSRGVTCNDDGCCDSTCTFESGQLDPSCGVSGTSRLRFDATAGVTYHVLVANGFWGDPTSCPAAAHLVLKVAESAPVLPSGRGVEAALNGDGTVTVTGPCRSGDLEVGFLTLRQPLGCGSQASPCQEQSAFDPLLQRCQAGTRWSLTTWPFQAPLTAAPAQLSMSGTAYQPATCSSYGYDSPVTIAATSPRAIMRDVTNGLSLWAGRVDPSTHLAAALEALSASLDATPWPDDRHLDGTQGPQVFQDDRTAVAELGLALAQRPGTPAATTIPLAVLLDARGRLVRADQLLVVTAIQDARAAAGEPKLIRAAEAELAKGDGDLRQGKLLTAIDHYALAWARAEGALGR